MGTEVTCNNCGCEHMFFRETEIDRCSECGSKDVKTFKSNMIQKKWGYVLKVLDRKIVELKEDHKFLPFILSHRIKELEAVKKILTEGTGYLGPSESEEGSKIIFFKEIA